MGTRRIPPPVVQDTLFCEPVSIGYLFVPLPPYTSYHVFKCLIPTHFGCLLKNFLYTEVTFQKVIISHGNVLARKIYSEILPLCALLRSSTKAKMGREKKKNNAFTNTEKTVWL